MADLLEDQVELGQTGFGFALVEIRLQGGEDIILPGPDPLGQTAQGGFPEGNGLGDAGGEEVFLFFPEGRKSFLGCSRHKKALLLDGFSIIIANRKKDRNRILPKKHRYDILVAGTQKRGY